MVNPRPSASTPTTTRPTRWWWLEQILRACQTGAYVWARFE